MPINAVLGDDSAELADAADLLLRDSVALLYVAEVLARRLDGANQALIELKNQLQAGQTRSVINKTRRWKKCWA